MGNSRPGGAPRPACGGSSGSGTGSKDAAGSGTHRTSGGPAVPAPAVARSGAHDTVKDAAPLLPTRGGPRSSGQGRGSVGPGNGMKLCSGMQQNGAAAERPRLGAPIAFKNTAPGGSLSRDSDRSAGSPKGAETPMSGSAGNGNGNAGGSSKKRKQRQTAHSYVKRFKPVQGANATDVAVVSPDRVGKENTSSGHVTNSNVSKVQPLKPTDVRLQNIADESSLPGKARNRPTAPARQSCLPSLQSVPISLVHHEEMKNTLGDREPISVQKEDSASGHVKVLPSDETDSNSNICVACGTPGTLRSCDGKGCQTRYHISCLDPSLEYSSPGIWFCISCTDKRFQFGLHSIVDGIESVWDVKEAEGMQNSKQYFVKYKNLAHVHNRWVPEGDINVTPGGLDLISLFNKRDHTEKAIWKEEWAKPHRLLRKRLLIPPKLADDLLPDIKYSYCTLEWLVKWRGLGYDHATWELETLPCLHTPEADQLKKNYENRREAAKQSSIPTKAKVKQSSFQELEKLPDGCHPDFDHDHLCSINRLREFWYKSCGAVLVDDKEFVIRTVLFTMSVLPDVSQPILIVTTPASLSSWEVQFSNLAPFVNVVVYDGGKDTLKLIQDFEFYGSGSMLQVLLTHADVVLEDTEPIARIGWEAVIVDYHQKSTLQYLEQLKQLSTDFRMLIVSSPIKDNLPEYMKLLGFLDSGEQENGNCVDTANDLVMSKVNFKSHIAYERRADSTKILEHWVPAYISQRQLEIYCSILLSNSSVLQSKMNSDGSLCDIIVSLSKCCDHPYIVDEFLQNSPVDNRDRTDTIDTIVQACGKLLLLQKLLKEIRSKRLRVIILFQSGAAGRNLMGDILERVVCDRFGRESYERVESSAPVARRRAAVNMFNDKAKGRFVFLIESHACVPSIKLSSVDAIIIFNSDCNPLKDLKDIQRIKIESQKYPGIFRLYTPFTVEEKQLLLAKHGMLIGNYKDMPHSLGHSLISWGASFLFTRFSKLQHDNYASKSFERDTLILEFLKKLAMNVEDTTEFNCTSISKANMSGEFYSRSITLIGEKVALPALDGDPSTFWLDLLDGKSPRWSNISEQERSSHRMLQNIEELAKVPAEEADEARRKRRKFVGITDPSSKCSPDNSHDAMLPKNCSTLGPPLQQFDDTQEKKGMKKLTTPKSLHVQLKQELSKLIKVLQLSDNARLKAEQFFEYYLNNHLVLPEPVDILHAFNIALCWRAASFLNYKVDRRESIALAEKSFNYEFNEALVGYIYTKLRILKEKVPNRAGETSIKGQPVSVVDNQLSWQETSTNLENDHMFQNKEIDLYGNFTNGAPQEVSSVAEQMFSEGQEPVQETHKECHVPNDEPPNMIVEKSIDLVDNVFSLRENNILCNQQLEISGLVTHRQNNVIRLKEVCSIVLEYIRRSQVNETTRSEKIKLTAQWFTMLICAFSEHMKLQHDKLEGLQSDAWSSERQLKEKLHQVAKSGQLDRDFDRHIALPASNFVMEEFIPFKEQNDEYRIAESSVTDCQQSSNDALSTEITLVRSKALSEPISMHAVENEPVETSVGSGGGPASEAVDFQESNIQCSSDGIGVQRAGCSSSTIPANDDCTVQESSTSECRNTEHIERDNIAKPSMFLGGATSLVRGVHANNDDILDTDGVHLELPNLASSQSLAVLVGTQAVLSCMPPQQSTDLGDVRMQVQEIDDGNLAADPVLPESPTYPAHSPVTLQVSTEVESQICEPSMAAKQSSSPPTQQSLAISRHPPAEAEPSSILGTEAAWDLQPEVQPSTSMQDEPAEAEDECEVEDEPVGMVTAHDLQSEIPSASVPAEQSTGLPSQQSLATSQHPPAEAKQADIVCTEPACALQPEVQPSTSDEPAVAEDEPEVPEDEPTEAERAGTLGAIAAQDLQPEMQSSTTTQDVPFERTYMSSMPVLQSPTIHQSVEPSLDPHAGAGVELAGMVPAHDLQSEILLSASVPTEKSTNLPAQQSLATSGRSPAEAEPADILGTEAACDLQTSQGEVQLSTTMQDQPAEGQACILGAIAAQSLQPGTQPSTSTQSAPFERTYLVGIPVLQQSHSVEPSLDPHARAESTHTLGEAEGAVRLGSMAAWDLQPELQSSTTVQHVPLERVHSEERRQIGFQPNMVLGPEQPTQHPPVTTLVLNNPNPILSDEPLKNELERLMHCNNVLSKNHEHKKSLLLIEYNQEIEKINKKYDSLLQKEDSALLHSQRELVDLHRKVFVNKSLAENFHGVFTPSSAAQGRSTSLAIEQPPVSSSAAQTAASPVISSSGIRPPGSYAVQPSFVAQPSLASWNAQPQSILHGNLHGTTSPPFVPAAGSYGSAGAQSRAVEPQSVLPDSPYRTMSPVPPPHLPRGRYGSAAAQWRAFSPHLQQLRMLTQYAMQAGAANPGPSVQYAPVITGSYASTVPQGPNSMDPSSVHQTVLPSASSSRPPPRGASSPPPGRHAEPMASYLQPSGSNPVFMPAHQQSSNVVLGSTSGTQNAAPGTQQHRGAQAGGVDHNESGYESASLSAAYMPARFGLGSSRTTSPAGAGAASPEVVCLSDDDEP